MRRGRVFGGVMVGLSLLVSLDILLTRSPLPADAKRVGKLESSASGFGRWSSPTGLQPNGELVIAGRTLRCGRVLNVLDPNLDNLGDAPCCQASFSIHICSTGTPTVFRNPERLCECNSAMGDQVSCVNATCSGARTSTVPPYRCAPMCRGRYASACPVTADASHLDQPIRSDH